MLERGNERVLRELLGAAHVAQDAREARDELRRLDAKYRFNRACWVYGRHDGKSFSAASVRRRQHAASERG